MSNSIALIDAPLSVAVDAFVKSIELLPEDLFLKSIDEWTPRDVVAHLAWWNRNMIGASQSLQAGRVPAYYADAANDYRNINAQAIAQFSSRDRRFLLQELQMTLGEFKHYLLALDPKEWDADHGVQHYRGGAVTIRRIVESLAGDYAQHTRQVKEWSARLGGELLDVIDEENNVIGQELRSIVHQRGLRHRGVDVFLFTRAGKLLVQTRTPTRATFPSALDCSAAEHVQASEDYLRAAVRGMKEEMGVEGIALKPILDFSHSNSSTDHETSRLYEGIVDPAQVHFDPVEVARIDYYTLSELDALMARGDVKFSRWFEHLLKWYLGKPHELEILKIF